MKVALLCNMNNNYFALLRYLRDLGVDATLFSFLDEHEHFGPESDTWYIEKWEKHIKKIDMSFYDPGHILKFNKKKVTEQLKDYDILIGSGPTPAYLYRIGRKLDIFIPYKTGVEYTIFAYPLRFPLTVLKMMNLKRLQLKGLQQCKTILNQDLRPITLDKIKSFDVPYYFLGIPMVYQEDISEEKMPADLKMHIDKIKKKKFILFHHGRHLWKQLKRRVVKPRPFINNNANDRVIRSFHKLLENNENAKKEALLVLFEYGPQIDLSKDLIKELGIEEYVLWMPIMSRKYILQLIRYATVGIGDVAVGFWGGKTYEFMINGVPVLNSLTADKAKFKKLTKKEIPPVLVTNTEEAIYEKVQFLFKNPEELKELKSRSKEWFMKYNGEELTKKIIYICTQLYNNEPINKELVYDYDHNCAFA